MEEGFTATIITTQPNDLMQPIHNRMPAILLPDLEERWLSSTSSSGEELSTFLGPYPSDEMIAQAVSSAVNTAGNEGPSLLDPRPRLKARETENR